MRRCGIPRNSLAPFMRWVSWPWLILLVTVGALPCRASAQAATMPTSLAPTYEVVSIRPMVDGDPTPTHIASPVRNGYIRAVNVNLKALLEVAYDIPDLRMFGGPEWVARQTFSLEARADPALDAQLASLPQDQARQLKRNMLAALLRDRFQLLVHTETRDLPIYAMVPGKGGARLGSSAPSAGTFPESDHITIQPGSDSLAILAYELSWRLGRPVLDRTGLQYRQALTLGWQDDAAASPDSSGPSLFTAIQEQLGLKLVSTKGPVAVLLIDHASPPAPN